MKRAEVLLVCLLVVMPFALLSRAALGRASLVPSGAWIDREQRGFIDAVLWDAIQQDTPWKIEMRRAYRAGRIPLYSFGAFCGSPLLANNQSGGLYPGNALYLLMAADRALGPTLFFHLVIGGCGALVLVRKLGGTVEGGVVAGLSLAASGTMLAFLPHPQMTAALALAPWVLWAFRGAAAGEGSRWIVALASLLGLQILAGHLQYTAFTVLACAAVATGGARGALRGGLGIAMGSALGSAGLMPTLELLAGSARKALDHPGGLFGGYQHSVPLAKLSTLVIPEIFGNPETGAYSGQANFRMTCMTVGIVPLALLLGAAWRKRVVRPLLALAVLGLLLALGTPLYGLVNAAPGFGSLKPARAIFLWTLGACLAAGLSVERGRAPIGGFVLAGALAVTVVALLRPDAGVIPSVARVVAVVAIGGALSATGRSELLPLLVALDLMLFSRPFVRLHPLADPYPETFELADLRALDERFSAPRFDILRPNVAMAAGLEDARGTDSFIPRRYHELCKRLDPRSDDMVRVVLSQGVERPVHAMLASVLVLDQEPDSFWIEHGYLEAIPIGGIQGARDRRSPPIAFFAERVRAAASRDEAIAAVVDPSFAPRSEAIVETSGIVAGAGSAELLGKSPDRLRLRVRSSDGGLCVIRYGYQPGWVARLPGRKIPVVPADGVFMGVPVPAATDGEMEVRYEPLGYRVGLFLSCVASTAALIMLAAPAGARKP